MRESNSRDLAPVQVRLVSISYSLVRFARWIDGECGDECGGECGGVQASSEPALERRKKTG
jgi:hypothetical protein